MMKASQRSYMLLEILLSLLIFAIAAWICLELLAAGGRAAEQAKELANAPTVAASAMEQIKSETVNGMDIIYDANWNRTDPEHFAANAGTYYFVIVQQGHGSAVRYRSGNVYVKKYERTVEGGELKNKVTQIYELHDCWLDEEVLR